MSQLIKTSRNSQIFKGMHAQGDGPLTKKLPRTIVHSKKKKNWSLRRIWKKANTSQGSVFFGMDYSAGQFFGQWTVFGRGKISCFAFEPTSKRSLQVCVVHLPIPPAACKDQSLMTLHCNCTGPMHIKDGSKISEMCWYISEHFFVFVKADVLSWMCINSSASLLSIWRRTSGFRVLLPILASSLLSIVDGWCFWIQKAESTGLLVPHPEK